MIDGPVKVAGWTTAGASISPESWLRRKLAHWTPVDRLIVWLIAVLGVLTTLAILLAPRLLLAAEDAVILFQYSRNLATTGAITYISHGPHAEGATDFLWMLLVALGMKLGAKPMWVVALLNLTSLGVISYVLLRIARARIRPLAVLFIIGAFGLVPQIFAAALGFSVLPFTALLLLLVYAFLQKNIFAMPIVALALCLFRPDGVVFAVPLLVAALLLNSNWSRSLTLDLAFFVLPGLLYFLWRWHYFHGFLPLPFLVKSDTQRKAHFLVPNSLQSAKPLLVFTFIVVLVALRRHWKDQQNRAVLLCVVVLPTLFYLAMRLDQNIGRRFFIYLPAGTAVLIAMNWRHLGPQSYTLLRTGILAWAVILCAGWVADGVSLWFQQCDTRQAIAQDIAVLPHGTLLTTEAGLAAYYSQWRTYDAWGLNTAKFARRLLQPSDVTDLNPDLVLVYTDTSPDDCLPHADWQVPYQQRQWSNLTHNIVAAVDPERYDLRIIPAGNSSYRAHEQMLPWQGKEDCWFVRRDSPMHDNVDAVLDRHGGMTFSQYESHQTPISANASAQQPVVRKSMVTSTLLFPARAALHLWRDIVY